MLENKTDFLAKFNIEEKVYKKSKLRWDDLKAIYTDFEGKIQQLNSVGLSISNALQVQDGVHSVRFRVKDPEHLIEKIIRKVSDDPSRVINLGNYEREITDLVGVRAIHLFKSNWKPINDFIQSTWELNETPIAYIRTGDSQEVRSTFETDKFDIKEHKIGYRSLHYIIKTKPTKVEHYVEIQVRTLFEEGWSEIDHKIRYPYDTNNDLIKSLLMIFNRLAGSADEMADYVRTLSIALKAREDEHLVILDNRDQEIEILKAEINSLKIKPEERTKLFESIKQIHKANNSLNLNLIGGGLSHILTETIKLNGLSDLSNSIGGISMGLSEMNGISLATHNASKAINSIFIPKSAAIKIPNVPSVEVPNLEKSLPRQRPSSKRGGLSEEKP